MVSKHFSGSIASILKYLILRTSRNWWLSLLLWIVLVGPAQAAVELRVAIKKQVSQVRVGSSTAAVVRNASGKAVGQMAAMGSFSAQPSRGNIALGQWRSRYLFIEPSPGGYVWIGDRWYRGRVRLVLHGKGMTAVNYVNLEEYLYSVVGAEAIPSWPLEALKTQAVAARSYALNQSSKGRNGIYDLDTTTATQVYKGLSSEYLSTHEAVNGTRGQVMSYGGQAILAAFHSSSGGHTENVEDVWTSPLPYLRGVVDYDQYAPVFQWQKTFSGRQLGKLIGGVGTVKSVTPEKTTPRGRIITMRVVGTGGTKRVSGNKLRKALSLRSTLFTVIPNGGNFEIYGRGFGHGIGLSQWGSQYLAEQGVNYQQILAHYYQNAQLAQIESR